MKKNKGFTLIELLAVIVILGILLSISVVAVNKIRKNQEEENKLNMISSILTGAKRYAADNRNILSNNETILVKTLKDEDYVDFDETNNNVRALDLINKKVYIGTCSNNLKLLYYTDSIGGIIYNDCGCESQYESVNKSAKLCKGNSCTTNDGVTTCEPVE